MKKPVVVIVEDDSVISELLVFNLKNDGYESRAFRDGQSLFEALQKSSLQEISLFILDIMLPGMDGFEICAKIRENPSYSWVPILMLTARGSENDKVKGLETGADDYLTKPFGMREFLARVQAQVRRYQQLAGSLSDGLSGSMSGSVSESMSGSTIDGSAAGKSGEDLTRPGLIKVEDILLDDIKHRVYRQGREIEMTNREYELLKFLMIHRGAAYSRDDLLNYVWGYEYSGETRTVDVHIRQLRRKLEQDDSNPVLIETVRGRGYRFKEADNS
jgi:two-component system alkaline phosphatase synthesis response regulator PhoP